MTRRLSSCKSAAEGLVPGDQGVDQFWFRDPRFGLCGTGSNFSNALRVNRR